MRLRLALSVLVTLVLGGLAVFAGVDVTRHFRSLRAEWGDVRLTRLDDALATRLKALRGEVQLTYYVTSRAEMPSHMRGLERQVIDLLQAMADAADGKVAFHVLDPTHDKDLQRYASNRTVSPVRVRHVARDQYSEQEVWSTLTIEYGPEKPARIEGVTPEHLPRLQTMILAHLDQLESPRRPVFGFRARADGYGRLRQWLAARGTVVDVDLEGGAEIPPEVDVLWWIDPGPVGGGVLRRLRHFVDAGKSAVIATGRYDASIAEPNGQATLQMRRNDSDPDTLLGAFGLRSEPGLLLDAKSAALNLPHGDQPAPFRVACLALNQDFQAMSREPRGTLMFVCASPFSFESERLSEEGWKAEVLATSSDESSVLPLPPEGDDIPLVNLMLARGRSVPKQSLLVWLRSVDPWKGSLVFCASPGIFRDETFDIDTLAHQRLCEVLGDTLASPDRLIQARSGIHRAPPLPPLSAGSRTLWRVVVVGLLPLLLLALAWIRRGGRGKGGVTARTGFRPGVTSAVVLRLVGGLLVVLVATVACRRLLDWRADWTADGVHQLAPCSQDVAGRATDDRALVAEFVFSNEAGMPPEMKGSAARIRQMLREFERFGADVTVQWTDADGQDEAGRAALAADGIEPTRFTSLAEEVTTVRTIWSALRLKGSGRVEVLRFPDPTALEDLEFRLAFALWRLETGERVRIGFASDSPRLTSAEAYQLFQSKGLIPPSGKDVYHLAREVLRARDFDVTHINPRDPDLPEDLDALVWLQPRRSVTPMLDQFVEYLYTGGRALLAAQHFNIQSRQYRGRGFDFVYWPAPQSPDVETWYYPDLGIELVREVLFDAVHTKIELPSQVNRTSRRDFQDMRLAKPFLIRALASNFDHDSRITRTLGDQAFLYANHFALDREKLAAHALTVTPLVTTSERAWSHDWKGGWIPTICLQESPPTAAGIAAALEEEKEEARANGADDEAVAKIEPMPITRLDRAPLALLVEGQFPWPEKEFQTMPVKFGPGGTSMEQEEPPDYAAPAPTDRAAPGRLVFLGESEMFKDHWLVALKPEFRPDHLLLNAVGELALEPALADVLVRRPVARGFDRVDTKNRVAWRAFVLLAAPLLLGLIALGRMLLVRRPVHRRPTVSVTGA